MKKLVIAAAIVCAAAFAQAGAVQWKSTYLNVYGQSGSSADVVNGSTVYLMNAGTTTQAAFLNALVNAGDKWTTEFSIQVAGALNSATQRTKKLTNPAKGELDGVTVVQDFAGASAALYMVMLDDVNKAVYVSELISKDISDLANTPFTYTHAGATAGNVFEAKGGFSDGGYYTFGAVSEPTTGNLSDWWSVRIDEKNRLVFVIQDGKLIIHSCRDHY